MELIISHSKSKREIKGSFDICGDAKDLRSMAEQILAIVNREEGFYKGWISIYDKQEAITNTPPIPWDS